MPRPQRDPATGRRGISSKRLAFVMAAGVLLLSAAAGAQVPEFPDSMAATRVVARTERYASTHTTSLTADYLLDQSPISGTARAYFLSTTTLFGEPATRDQVDALIDVEYAVPQAMRLFLLLEGTLSNDVRGSGSNGGDVGVIPGLNNTAATFVGIGGRAGDIDGNRVGIAVGGAYNRQLNVEDGGGAVYGELGSNLDLSGYKIRLDAKGRWYNVVPRHNSNGYVDLHAAREFAEGADATLDLRYDLNNTDLYVKRAEEQIILYGGPTYDGLQGREERKLRVGTTFRFPIADSLGLVMTGFVTDASIEQQERGDGLPPLPRDPEPFRYGRGDLLIGGVAGANWTPPGANVDLRLEYYNSEQRNTVDPTRGVSEVELRRKRDVGIQNDFVSRQLLFAGTAEVRLSRRDTISAGGSVGIYRYDTPSPTNYFDKDEQSIQGQIRFARMFSPSLSFSIYSQVFLTHLVYLFGQNSNDNNWNRVFRLVPAVRYTIGDAVLNMFEAELLANYTDYDFEGRTQDIRGRSFRELHLRDSLAIAITGSLGLSARGDLRISERGSFSWNQFAESLLERTRTEGIEGMLTTRSIGGMTMGAGMRLSRVKSYRVDLRNNLVPFSDRTSFGPTASILARFQDGATIDCSGWWEHRFDQSELVARVPWLFLTVSMNL